MSATRLATEFSIGIIASIASLFSTAANTSSKDGQGWDSMSGYFRRQARSEYAPSSPWKATLPPE